MAITLETLTANAKQIADRVDDTFVTDATWYQWINRGRRRLFDILVEADPERYEATDTGNLVIDQEDYALPSDFYKLIAVDVKDSTNNWRTVTPYSQSDANLFRDVADYTSAVLAEYRYRLKGTNIRILPAPTSTFEYRLRYVAYPTDLVVSPGTPNTLTGLEEHLAEFVEVYAAMRAYTKANMDVSTLRSQYNELKRDAEKRANDRMGVYPSSLGGGRHLSGRRHFRRGYRSWP